MKTHSNYIISNTALFKKSLFPRNKWCDQHYFIGNRRTSLLYRICQTKLQGIASVNTRISLVCIPLLDFVQNKIQEGSPCTPLLLSFHEEMHFSHQTIFLIRFFTSNYCQSRSRCVAQEKRLYWCSFFVIGQVSCDNLLHKSE